MLHFSRQQLAFPCSAWKALMDAMEVSRKATIGEE